MNKMSIRGSRIFPWGRPLLRVAKSDVTLHVLTLTKRPVKKIENHVRRFPPI